MSYGRGGTSIILYDRRAATMGESGFLFRWRLNMFAGRLAGICLVEGKGLEHKAAADVEALAGRG